MDSSSSESLPFHLKTDEIDQTKADLQTKAVAKGAELLTKQSVVILADEVGMGKTFEALGVVFLESLRQHVSSKRRSIPKTLIIVPSTALKLKWERDIRKFAEKCISDNSSYAKLRTSFAKPRVVYGSEDFRGHSRIVVASSGWLVRNRSRRRWDLIVIDEAHKFKNKHTKRYSLFSDTEDPTFHQHFRKLVLLTATPFQLDPDEMADILKLGTFGKFFDKHERDELDKRIFSLRDSLATYSEEVERFENTWQGVSPHDRAALETMSFPVASNSLTIDPTSSPSLREAIALVPNLTIAKEGLQNILSEFIVRNTKSSTYRKQIHGSLVIDDGRSSVSLLDDEELFYLLVKRFVHELRGRTFPAQILQETTSSYATLKKYPKACLYLTKSHRKFRDLKVREYRDAVLEAIEGLQSSGKHPKLRELLVNLGLRGKVGDPAKSVPLEKTLVFCRFVETANEISRTINRQVDSLTRNLFPQTIVNEFWRMETRRAQGRKSYETRRYTERFEKALSQIIKTRLDRIFSANPRVRDLCSEDYLFRRYEKQTGRIERIRLVIRVELENVLRGKMKENVLLYTILRKYSEMLDQGGDGKGYLMLGRAIQETFDEAISNYLGSQLEAIEKQFPFTGEQDSEILVEQLIEGLRRQEYAAVLSGGTKSLFQERLMGSFNSPFNPRVLVVTQVGQEGIDLQRECSKVVHYDLWWNPAVMEQRVGRVDRVGSKISRLLDEYEKRRQKGQDPGHKPNLDVYVPFIRHTIDEDIFHDLKEREKWFKLIIGKKPPNENEVTTQQLSAGKEVAPLPNSVVDALTIDLKP